MANGNIGLMKQKVFLVKKSSIPRGLAWYSPSKAIQWKIISFFFLDPNFAFVIVCKPASMEVNISRESLPSDVEPSDRHLADPACGVHHVSNKNIIMKAPLEGCGTLRR